MFKARVGFVIASGCVVLACGSSSTTGTNKGGLGGLFGGGNATGSGATTGNVVPNNCTVSPAEDACTTCLKQDCCTPLAACSGSAECNALVNCISACNGDQTCGTNCVNAHPDGKAPVQTLISCEQQSCAAACESDSSSNTSSGSNGAGCLEDPPDTTLCSAIPGKTHAKDCPDGPPNAQCVAQPENLHGIWCCP